MVKLRCDNKGYVPCPVCGHNLYPLVWTALENRLAPVVNNEITVKCWLCHRPIACALEIAGSVRFGFMLASFAPRFCGAER